MPRIRWPSDSEGKADGQLLLRHFSSLKFVDGGGGCPWHLHLLVFVFVLGLGLSLPQGSLSSKTLEK
jgi:hypothetical protein